MAFESSLKFPVCNLSTIMGIFVEASTQAKFLVDFSILNLHFDTIHVV